MKAVGCAKCVIMDQKAIRHLEKFWEIQGPGDLGGPERLWRELRKDKKKVKELKLTKEKVKKWLENVTALRILAMYEAKTAKVSNSYFWIFGLRTLLSLLLPWRSLVEPPIPPMAELWQR